MQDSDNEFVNAVADGNCKADCLSEKDRALLVYAEKLTFRPAQMTPDDVAALHQAGWQDPEIAEAVYIISLFAFFNRVADAFGLQDPGYRSKAPVAEQNS